MIYHCFKPSNNIILSVTPSLIIRLEADSGVTHIPFIIEQFRVPRLIPCQAIPTRWVEVVRKELKDRKPQRKKTNCGLKAKHQRWSRHLRNTSRRDCRSRSKMNVLKR